MYPAAPCDLTSHHDVLLGQFEYKGTREIRRRNGGDSIYWLPDMIAQRILKEKVKSSSHNCFSKLSFTDCKPVARQPPAFCLLLLLKYLQDTATLHYWYCSMGKRNPWKRVRLIIAVLSPVVMAQEHSQSFISLPHATPQHLAWGGNTVTGRGDSKYGGTYKWSCQID